MMRNQAAGARPTAPLPSAVAAPSLRGPWLALARVAWVALAGVIVALLAAGVPAALRQLGVPCSSVRDCGDFRLYPEDVLILERAGLSLRFYTLYAAGLTLVGQAPILGAAVVLFWRKSSTWVAMFVSFANFLLIPTVFTNITSSLVRENLAWAWPVAVLQMLGLWSGLVIYYIFPNGQLVPRWAGLIAVLIAGLAVLNAFPALWSGLGFSAEAANWPGSAALLPFFLAGLAAQIYRYHTASGPVERQQTKWVVLAFTVYALNEIVFYALLLNPSTRQPGLLHLLHNLAGGTLNVLLLSLVPSALMIAILRYRLWDVDLLIRRTLVYGVLTLLLGLMYLGSVLGLEQVFRTVTGTTSNAVTVVSVLAIAAISAPLRRAVQGFIDRRFFRSRYDAARVLAAFGAALRDEVNLETLSAELLEVVDRTLRPEQVSLWLRPPRG